MSLHIPHPHLSHRQALAVLWSLVGLLMLAEALVAFHVVHVHEAVEGVLVIVGWSREWMGRAIERVALAALE